MFTYTALQITTDTFTVKDALHTSRLPLTGLTQIERAIQRACLRWDAHVSLAHILDHVQLERAWRGGPFNMIAPARHVVPGVG